MSSRLSDYQATGPAEGRRARRAVAVDGVAVALLVVVLWPFPFFRLTLGLPWAVHVPLLLGVVLAGEWVYGLVCVRIWGRTVGMYLLDLGLDGAPRPFRPSLCARWSAGSALAFASAAGAFGTVDPGSGLPARMSGLRTVSTA